MSDPKLIPPYKGPKSDPDVMPQKDQVNKIAADLLKQERPLTLDDISEDLIIRGHLSLLNQTRRMGVRAQAVRALQAMREAAADRPIGSLDDVDDPLGEQ